MNWEAAGITMLALLWVVLLFQSFVYWGIAMELGRWRRAWTWGLCIMAQIALMFGLWVPQS
jgi:hypothetical protein